MPVEGRGARAREVQCVEWCGRCTGPAPVVWSLHRMVWTRQRWCGSSSGGVIAPGVKDPRSMRDKNNNQGRRRGCGGGGKEGEVGRCGRQEGGGSGGNVAVAVGGGGVVRIRTSY